MILTDPNMLSVIVVIWARLKAKYAKLKFVGHEKSEELAIPPQTQTFSGCSQKN